MAGNRRPCRMGLTSRRRTYGRMLLRIAAALDLTLVPDVQPYFNLLQGRAALSLAAGNDAMTLNWESVPDQPPLPPRESVPGDARAIFRAMRSDTPAAVAVGNAPALLSGVDSAINS